MSNTIQSLKQWIEQSNDIVFFGGAGVSTESGIPDFRSVDGLYHQKYSVPPEVMLSHSFFMQHPKEFFEFYREKMIAPHAKPNAAHKALAKLEQQGKLRSVITQNIDGLHEMAGSKQVCELHGSVHHNYCISCKKNYPASYIIDCKEDIPTCEICGSMVRPDVVLYEEPLNEQVLNTAISHLQKADMLIIGGTSLVVYPAAGLIRFYNGSKLVLINKSTTSMDHKADLVISDSIGEVFEQLDIL